MTRVSRAWRTASLMFSRNPLIRPTDRALSALAWLLAFLAMAVVPVAATAGSVAHAQRAESAQVEQRTRYQVQATLTADTEKTTAPAWWLTADGRVHTGTVGAPSVLRAGDTVPIWVDDRTGATVGQPRTTSSAVGDGVAVTLAVLAGTGVVLGALYWLARALLTHRARTAWQRQWRDVEPRWTGRIGREPA